MKLSQLFQKAIIKSFQKPLRFQGFAQLSKEVDEDDSINKYTNAREYYDYLKRFTPSDSLGYVKFHESQFTKMINIANSAEDVEVVREAFYNFLGHKLKLSNSQLDKFVQKAIELKGTSPVHEILANHNYLHYYPHPNILKQLAQHYVESNNAENLLQLSSIYAAGYLLKIDAATLQIISDYASATNNQAILQQVVKTISIKKTSPLSEEIISQLIASIARKRLESSEQSEENDKKSQKQVETQFLEYVQTIPQTYKTIVAKAFLALADKDIDGSLVALANFHQIDQNKLSNPSSVISSNEALVLEFLENLDKAISESKKPKYAERLAKVIEDISTKLGQNVISQAVADKVKAIVEKNNQPASPPPAEEAQKPTEEKPQEVV